MKGGSEEWFNCKMSADVYIFNSLITLFPLTLGSVYASGYCCFVQCRYGRVRLFNFPFMLPAKLPVADTIYSLSNKLVTGVFNWRGRLKVTQNLMRSLFLFQTPWLFLNSLNVSPSRAAGMNYKLLKLHLRVCDFPQNKIITFSLLGKEIDKYQPFCLSFLSATHSWNSIPLK